MAHIVLPSLMAQSMLMQALANKCMTPSSLTNTLLCVLIYFISHDADVTWVQKLANSLWTKNQKTKERGVIAREERRLEKRKAEKARTESAS
jgi:hypothetical protein